MLSSSWMIYHYSFAISFSYKLLKLNNKHLPLGAFLSSKKSGTSQTEQMVREFPWKVSGNPKSVEFPKFNPKFQKFQKENHMEPKFPVGNFELIWVYLTRLSSIPEIPENALPCYNARCMIVIVKDESRRAAWAVYVSKICCTRLAIPWPSWAGGFRSREWSQQPSFGIKEGKGCPTIR